MSERTQTPMFEDFEPISQDRWQEKIEQELKGNSIETLNWRHGPLHVKPFYREEINEDKKSFEHILDFIRQGINPEWKIKACLNCNTIKNKDLLSFLEKGCNSISLENFHQNRAVLDGVHLDMIRLEISKEEWPLLKKHFEINSPEKVNLTVAYSPFKDLVRRADFSMDWEKELISLKDETQSYSNLRLLKLEQSFFEECGANIVQQLSYSLSLANEYFDKLNNEISIDDLSALCYFDVAIGPSYFLEIAKLRAIRILYAELVKAYAPEHNCSAHTYLMGKTSSCLLGKLHTESNLIRNGIAAMASALGMCDEIAIQQHDEKDVKSDGLALNLHHVLKEEAHLGKVTDISKGSFYIDHLTYDMVGLAWKEFMRIESQGGFFKALSSGHIQKEISKSASKRVDALNTKKIKMVGENYYQLSGQEPCSWALEEDHLGFSKIVMHA